MIILLWGVDYMDSSKSLRDAVKKSPHFERLVTSLILLLQSEAAQNLPVDTWRQLGALKKYLLDTSHSGHRSVPKS